VTTTITVARLERAIELTARAMTIHELPELLPILHRLERERDRLAQQPDALEYAKRILAKSDASNKVIHDDR
jgi:hypothetical protein